MPEEFATTLIREKFTVIDVDSDIDSSNGKNTITALSNRMEIVLDNGTTREIFVVRTQNMHSCVRMIALIYKDFMQHGEIMNRPGNFNFQRLWGDIIKGYEADWNPDIWCCVYHKGRVVYEYGNRHPFLDVVEQCNAREGVEYEQAVPLAEKIFSQAGKNVKINHEQNLALIISAGESKAKCSVISRCADRTATFNFTVTPLTDNIDSAKVEPYAVLSVAAGYLEGIQLAFISGVISKKLALEIIAPFSNEARKGKRASERLGNINRAILQFEQKYNVSYRPARPVFKEMVETAENNAMRTLIPLMTNGDAWCQ